MNKKVISWALYDWANSVFFTTVMAGFFPVFFKKYWNSELTVSLSTERLGYILALTGFLLAVLSPLLGVISDTRRTKKKLMFVFMMIGSITTAGLFFVSQGDWFTAAVLYGVAFFSASASCLFNDSLLPSVTTPDQYDRVSSLGYSLGYLGGGLLFIVNVFMYQKPEWFGLSSGAEGVRWSFISVAIWWFVFTLPNMLFVEEPSTHHLAGEKKKIGTLFINALKEIKNTFLQLIKDQNIFLFIVAYWFYIDGVSTVMSMAVDFGMALGFEAGDLIKALLLTQFVGFPSALLMGWLSPKIGIKNTISLCLVIYVFVVLGASQMTSVNQFYLMAALIGLSQGGVQALSRALFAQLIPAEKSGEYFGFFNLLGRFASVLGPLLMALAARFFKTPQLSILSLLILFVFGLYFLTRVKIVVQPSVNKS